MFGGPPGPVIEPTQAAATGEDPEDLGHLHHGVIVFGGGGIGAENMFQPDPVVFLGVKRVFDQVPFSAAAVDHGVHALGRKIGEIGDVGVEGGTGCGGDFTLQNDMGLVFAQLDVLAPAKVLLPLFAILPEPAAEAVGAVQGQQADRFVPGGGLAAFLESEHVHPIELFAGHDDGLTA